LLAEGADTRTALVCPTATSERAASFKVMASPEREEASCQRVAPPVRVATREESSRTIF